MEVITNKNRGMQYYMVNLSTGQFILFRGIALPNMESKNWHYYQTEAGNLLHFSKSNMVAVAELSVEAFQALLENGSGLYHL